MYYTPINVPAVVSYWLILCLWLAGAPFAAAAALLRLCWRHIDRPAADGREQGKG